MTIRMKNSDIEWIGEIPIDWEVVPIKYHFFSKKQIAGIFADNYERLALTLNGVIKRSKQDSEGLQPEKFETYQIVRKNDLIFKLIDLENIKTSRIGLSKYIGIVSPAYILLTRKGDILPEYAEKYFLNMWYQHIFNDLGSAGVRSNLNKEDLLNLPIVKPPIIEQKRINKFLNTKINIIDDEINQLEKLIEKYNEYKNSVITEVVTSGLDNNIKLKNSNIDWIGKIPEHWEIKKLNYVSSDENHSFSDGPFGSDLKNEEYVDEGIPIIQLNNIKAGFHDFTNEHYITEEKYNQLKKHSVKPGDIVIAKMAPVARATIVSDKYEKYVIVADCIKLNCNSNFLNKYVTYSLNSYMYHDAVQKAKGITRLRINLSELKKIKVLMPPIDEQHEIVEYLDKKCDLIDSLIKEKEQLIDNLENYKRSLIFEYVTGKKEVPHEI